VSGGTSSITALAGSTEEQQFEKQQFEKPQLEKKKVS
jgi:hypothetical protein